MATQKITLKVIADQADLSIASVSRVLRTPQITSWETQKRVHQVIKRLNIDTDHLLKPYQQQANSQKILVIDNQLLPNSQLNNSIETELALNDYQIFYFRFLHVTQHDLDQIIHYALNHSFDGILIINEAPYLTKLMKYKKSLPPVVLVNQFSLDLPCVYFDHLMLAFQVTTHFVTKSHKRIAILLGDENKSSAKYLIQGYQQALQRADIQIQSNYIIKNCFSYEHGKRAIKNLMKSPHPPTAVIFADHICLSHFDNAGKEINKSLSPYNAIRGAVQQCHEMDITVPDQLALLYFSHDTLKQHNELDILSCLNKPLHTMGKRSANLLLKLLQKKTSFIQTTNWIEAKLIFKQST